MTSTLCKRSRLILGNLALTPTLTFTLILTLTLTLSQTYSGCGKTSHHGVLSIKLLTSFLTRHKEKAALIATEFASSRRRHCSLPHTAHTLTRYILEALSLSPSLSEEPRAQETGKAGKPRSSAFDCQTVIPLLAAKEGVWSILSEERAMEELFDMSIFTFDDVWKHCTDRRGTLAHSSVHALCLSATNTLLKQILHSAR